MLLSLEVFRMLVKFFIGFLFDFVIGNYVLVSKRGFVVFRSFLFFNI